MNSQIPPMDDQLKNLFPTAVKMGMIEIFDEQSVQPFMLRLLAADTATGLLHPKEKTVFSGYRLAKRRTEYLTGRICAKKAVQAFWLESGTCTESPALSEIEIAHTTNGRPIVYLPGAKANQLKVDISISHSGEYAAALTAQSPCGIDVQMQKSALLTVREKYCNETENSLLANRLVNCEHLTRLTLLWAAKEAGKKALSYWQMPGFLNLELCGLTSFPGYCTLSLKIRTIKNSSFPDHITVVAATFGDYALALCLVPVEGGNAGAA